MGAMSVATTLGIISAVGFGLSVVCVLVAVVLFFALDIRGVRNQLTGRTAEREIAHMRASTWAARRSRERSARRIIAGSNEDTESQSLHVRISEEATTLFSDADDAKNDSAVLRGKTVQGDEEATTLFDEDESAAESATTLFSPTSEGGE